MLSFPRSTRSHFALATCLVLVLALVSGCGSEEQKRAEALREAGGLYELAVLANGLDRYIAELAARAAAYHGGLDAQTAERLHAAVTGAINPDEARAVAIEAFAARYEKITGVQVRAWYEGVVGARILAMEVEAGEGDYEAKLREFLDHRLLSEVPRAERTTLIKRLVTATRANSDEATADAGMMRTLYMGERLLQPEAERRTVEEIETSLANRAARCNSSTSTRATMTSRSTPPSASPKPASGSSTPTAHRSPPSWSTSSVEWSRTWARRAPPSEGLRERMPSQERPTPWDSRRIEAPS